MTEITNLEIRINELQSLSQLAVFITLNMKKSEQVILQEVIKNILAIYNNSRSIQIKLTLNKVTVKTENFTDDLKKTKSRQFKNIVINREERGSVEIYYFDNTIKQLSTVFLNSLMVFLTNYTLQEPIDVSLFTEKLSHEILDEAKLDSYQLLKGSLINTISAVAQVIEKRDPYTAGHQKKVAALSVLIAKELGLTEDQIEGIRLGALIHDIGKINVPSDVLSKPGKLREEEFALIKIHPEVGWEILKNIEFPWPIDKMILQHHERLDGSGYPKGLKKDEIALEAQILAVADVVEAMVSHRPYRPALGVDAALLEIEKGAGKLYNADVVRVCIKLFKEKGFVF